MDKPTLTETEIEVLRMMSGEAEGRWGAAVSASLEFLQEFGYCTRGPNYQITDAGRKALHEATEAAPNA